MRGYLRGTWEELSGCPNAPIPRRGLRSAPETTVRGRHTSPAMVWGHHPHHGLGAAPLPRRGLGRPPLAARIVLGAQRLIPRAAADAAAPKPLAQRFLRRHLASRICIQGPV